MNLKKALKSVPGEERREEADCEGRGERRHEQHRQDQPLARSDAPLARRCGRRCQRVHQWCREFVFPGFGLSLFR